MFNVSESFYNKLKNQSENNTITKNHFEIIENYIKTLKKEDIKNLKKFSLDLYSKKINSIYFIFIKKDNEFFLFDYNIKNRFS